MFNMRINSSSTRGAKQHHYTSKHFGTPLITEYYYQKIGKSNFKVISYFIYDLKNKKNKKTKKNKKQKLKNLKPKYFFFLKKKKMIDCLKRNSN